MKLNTPNKITVTRLFLALALIVVFSLSYLPSSATFAPEFVWGGFHTGFNWIRLVSCLLFIAGSVTDSVDGHIARSRNLITDFGKFMDPLADKFLVDSALILLCTQKDFSGHYQVLPFLVVLFIGRDLAMDGLRILANAQGRVLAANIWGKTKTAMQMILIPFLFLNGFPFSLLNVSSGLDAWMASRFASTYILTNVLTGIALFFSLLSAFLYFRKNKDLFQGAK